MSLDDHLAKPNQTKPNVCPKPVLKLASLLPAAVVSCERSFQTHEENIWGGSPGWPACAPGLFNL